MGDPSGGRTSSSRWSRAKRHSRPTTSPSPTYAAVNLSAAQKIPIKGTRGAQVRFDALNLFDNSYQIRDGTGVGVGAPQFGKRRAFSGHPQPEILREFNDGSTK